MAASVVSVSSLAGGEDGGALVGHHRVVAAAVSPVVNFLHAAVGQVDPVAAVGTAVTVTTLAVAEVGVAR